MYIWDLNLRLFHWLLVFLIVLSIISGKMNFLYFHQFFGSMSLGLICFRIFWGFYGTYHSRFKNTFYTPKEVFLYIRGGKSSMKKKATHNPLGNLSVISFYFLITILSLSGLFSTDDILFEGPLTFLIPEQSTFFTKIHNLFHYFIYVLIGLHLSTILFYQFVKKQKLINQMIDGRSRTLLIKSFQFFSGHDLYPR